jgi:hypothetical protein
MKAIRTRVHDLTDARRSGVPDLETMIQALNPVLRGWGNYFRTGNADREFNKLDRYVYERIKRWQWRRGGQRTKHRFDRWPQSRLYGMGLHKLQGTVCYPVNVTGRRSSVSRVRETRMHGLTGAFQPVIGTSDHQLG